MKKTKPKPTAKTAKFSDFIRFYGKISVNDVTGCWEWVGCICANGYGKITVWDAAKNRWVSEYAHRWSLAHFYYGDGPIPPGITGSHLCEAMPGNSGPLCV